MRASLRRSSGVVCVAISLGCRPDPDDAVSESPSLVTTEAAATTQAAATTTPSSDTRPSSDTTPNPDTSPSPDATTTGLGTASQCTRSFAGLPVIDAAVIRSAEVTALDGLAGVAKPGQRLVVEGFPVEWRKCPPCPDGASCKPCESFVVLATAAAVGIKQPVMKDVDLWIITSDPEMLVRGTRYRVVVDVCDGPPAVGGRPHVEWRGVLAL